MLGRLNFQIALQSSDGDELGTCRWGQHQRWFGQGFTNHVVSVKGFVTAICPGTKWCASVQQDLLNLLTCLFQVQEIYKQDVTAVINDCIGTIEIEAWLGFFSFLQRIHIKEPSVRSVLHPRCWFSLGKNTRKLMMYPLSVLLKSPVAERKSAAEPNVLTEAHSSELVEENTYGFIELIRCNIHLMA
jgi:FKBP12-rapamycin complex-associated protein